MESIIVLCDSYIQAEAEYRKFVDYLTDVRIVRMDYSNTVVVGEHNTVRYLFLDRKYLRFLTVDIDTTIVLDIDEFCDDRYYAYYDEDYGGLV